jgi:hypothetical protein
MPTITSLADLVWTLLTYGEDDVAERAKAFTRAELGRVWQIADTHAATPSGRKDGSGMLLAQALASAAVEVAEGGPRPLKWEHRKLDRERPKMRPEDYKVDFTFMLEGPDPAS